MPKNKTLYLIVGLVIVAVAALAVGANSELFQGYLRKTTEVRRTTSTDTSRKIATPTFSAERVALDSTIERDGLIDAAALKINTSSSIDRLRFQVDSQGIKIRRFYIFLDGNDVTLKLSEASRLLLEQSLDAGAKIIELEFAPSLKVKAGAMLKIRADLGDVGNEIEESFSLKILDATVSGQLYTIENIEYTFNIERTMIEEPAIEATYTPIEGSAIEATYSDVPAIEATYTPIEGSAIEATYSDVPAIEATYTDASAVEMTTSDFIETR